MSVYGIFWEFFRPHSYKGWPTSLSFFGDSVLLLLGTATVWGEKKSWQTWCCLFQRFPVFAGHNNCPNDKVQVVQGIRRKKLGFSDIYVSEMGLGTQRHLGDSIVGGFGIDSMDGGVCLVAGLLLLVGVGLLQVWNRYTSAEKQRERDSEWGYDMYQYSLVGIYNHYSSSRSVR